MYPPLPVNPSFTKRFGAHTFYQGEGGWGGGVGDVVDRIPCYLKSHCLHEREICLIGKNAGLEPRSTNIQMATESTILKTTI